MAGPKKKAGPEVPRPAAAAAGAARRRLSPASADDLAVGEEELDFLRCGVRRVGAVHRVGFDGLGEIGADGARRRILRIRSEEHTSELQSLMRISYAVFCLKKKK